MIKINNLVVLYTKDYNILNDISLTIKTGEKIVIFGEVDSGKSTLLRVITGLEKTFQGEIFLENTPIDKIDLKEDVSMAYLPAQPVFLERKTVKANLEYPLEIRKTSKEMRDIKVSNVVTSYGLGGIVDKKVKDLSYFERLKVALARFALRNIEYLIIDDVFEKLSADEQKRIINYINDLYVANSATCIVATSDENLVKKIGGRKISLSYGSIVD